MFTGKILKWTIPVDDQAHEGGDFPVHVACMADDYENVYIWTHSTDAEPTKFYRIYGTGQPTPKGAEYIGTAPALNGALAWHVFDVTNVVE